MAKKINLTGCRFGLLIVISENGYDRHGRMIWNCRCDCGARIIAQSGNLRSGNTKSCGCLRRKPSPHRDYLIGQRFGMLEVLSQGVTRSGRTSWLCRCECGKEVVAQGVRLKRGVTKSCGCFRRIAQRERMNVGLGRWASDAKCAQEGCLKCGVAENLHAHHIYGATANPRLARDASNSAVLCEDCHKEFHRLYGKGSHGPRELAEFLGLDSLQTKFIEKWVGWKGKGGVEDLKKAIHVLEMLIEWELSNV